MLSSRKWLHMDGFADLEAQDLGSGRGSALAFTVTAAPPGHECTADCKQRRGVLREHRQRRDSACCHKVESALSQLLHPRMNRAHVVGTGRRDPALDERTLARMPIGEHELGFRPRERERQPRKAATGPDVEGPLGDPDVLEVERDERISDVFVRGALWLSHGRRSMGIGGKQLEQCVQAPIGAGGQSVALDKRRDPIVDGAHAAPRARSRAINSA